jgi:hypothetical protein
MYVPLIPVFYKISAPIAKNNLTEKNPPFNASGEQL